jgi:sphingosine kinase
MQRPDYATAIKMPIGCVPGGSGNGLAHAINYAVGDSHSPPILASTLNIARGKQSAMDLVKITTSKETMYSFLSIGWGLIADIDIESERLRIVGGFRFTVWALVRTAALRKYKGRLSYLPLAGYEEEHIATNSNGTSDKVQSQKTQSSSDLNNEDIADQDTEHMAEGSSDKNTNGLKNGSNINTNGFEKDTEVTATANIGNTTGQLIPELGQPLPDNWVVVDGDFILVYTAQQTHLSADCLFAPKAKLDDGVIWLLFIKGSASRGQILSFLTALDSGTHIKLPFLTMVPVRAFRLEPTNNQGRLTVDGELIECGPIQAEVLPAIARVMTR